MHKVCKNQIHGEEIIIFTTVLAICVRKVNIWCLLANSRMVSVPVFANIQKRVQQVSLILINNVLLQLNLVQDKLVTENQAQQKFHLLD